MERKGKGEQGRRAKTAVRRQERKRNREMRTPERAAEETEEARGCVREPARRALHQEARSMEAQTVEGGEKSRDVMRSNVTGTPNFSAS